MARESKQYYSVPSMTVIDMKGNSVLCASTKQTDQLYWHFMLEGDTSNGSLIDGGSLNL